MLVRVGQVSNFTKCYLAIPGTECKQTRLFSISEKGP